MPPEPSRRLTLYLPPMMWPDPSGSLGGGASATEVSVASRGGRALWWNAVRACALRGVHGSLGASTEAGGETLIRPGGGFLIVPAFRKFSDVRIHAVVSTSLMVVALVSLGTLGNLMRQGVSLSTEGVLFIVATLVGMIAGRVISPKVSAQLLQQGFAVLCALVSVLMFAKVLMMSL